MKYHQVRILCALRDKILEEMLEASRARRGVRSMRLLVRGPWIGLDDGWNVWDLGRLSCSIWSDGR